LSDTAFDKLKTSASQTPGKGVARHNGVVQAHLRTFQPARAAAPAVKSSVPMIDAAKRKALSAIGNVETLAHTFLPVA